MNDKLNLELAKEYYKLAPKASISLIALIGVTLYFYWGKIPTHLLITWSGVNLTTACMFLVASRYFKLHGSQANAAKWLRIYALLLFLQDAPWGLIGPMSFMVDDPLYQMLTLFMLAGMTAGSIITHGIILRIYAISLFSLLTPIIVTLALQGTPITDAMLAMVLIYTVFMLAVAKSYSASINRNIQLWLDNEQLVEELRTSHNEAEKYNRDLSSEIEHRKQMELELTEAKERSERANEAKDQFLATVSHELRTPLNGIVGFADFLQHEKLEDKAKHYITQINKAGKILQRIVNDILDITAIEAGHIRLYDEPFSLRTEMQDLLDMLAPLAESKKLSLRLHVDESVTDDLSGDISRLRQIIGNLLSNALKYTEVGHVALKITHLNTRNGKEVLRFDVEDTGVGINEEALEFIFKNFTRLENFETHRSDGMGLGLAIVKSLVKRMGGVISVQSQPIEGSCFSCELAFEQSHAADIQTRQEQNEELSQAQYQTLKILVVDDNEINRILLAAFLADLDIQFTEASCGQEALEHILTGKYNLVLMDIQMPDISGVEVAKRIRGKLANMPVMIAVTAHAFPEQRDAILDAGFSYFISKPITIDDLTKALMHTYQSIHLEEDVAEVSG
jgi:signal transduction histidine kinase/ActR/RegA family two-component response regulator